jgi:anthranilate phosphoribosyltransferase
MNVGAALLVADRVRTMRDGLAAAARAIDSGAARATLQRMVQLSRPEAA